MKLPRGWTPAVLGLAVVLGVGLRLWPTVHPPGTEFLSDGATIARLALDSARLGRLPAVDSLAEAPAGRPLPPVLAPGWVVTAGQFHRLMGALGSRDPNFNLCLLGAICGGLIAIPVFAWARALWGPGPAAVFAALLAVFLPAHLHRTFGYFMRYEPAGVLVLTSHLAAFAASLAATDLVKRRATAVLSALLMLAALWMWRVPLFLPVLEAILIAGLLVARGAEPAVRELFALEVVVLTAGMFGLDYLRIQGIPGSAAWLATVAVAAVAWVPRLAPGRAKWPERLGWLAGALALAWLGSRLAGARTGYGAMSSYLPIKWKMMLGIPVELEPLPLLMLSIEELGTVSPIVLLIGAMSLGFLGPWLVASPLVYWLAAGRPGWKKIVAGIPSRHFVLAGLTVAMLVLALFMYRTKVLLAPVVAVAVAGLLPRLLAPAWPRPRRPRDRESERRGERAARGPVRRAGGESGGSSMRPVLVWRLIASLGANLWLSVVITATRASRMPAGQRAALRFLATETPAGATVGSLWENGFEIPSYAGRRSVVDGFLESGDGAARVVDQAHAALDRSPEPLAQWCRRYGASYLLVPPSTRLMSVALIVDPVLTGKLDRNEHLTQPEADRTLIRMMVFGRDEPPFRKVFERDLWRVYALTDSAAHFK
jgi:hypothetical protein